MRRNGKGLARAQPGASRVRAIGDEDLIGDIVGYLVDNAIKYTDQGDHHYGHNNS